MANNVSEQVNEIARERRGYRYWLSIFLVLALVVAALTLAVLKLTGIALSDEDDGAVEQVGVNLEQEYLAPEEVAAAEPEQEPAAEPLSAEPAAEAETPAEAETSTDVEPSSEVGTPAGDESAAASGTDAEETGDTQEPETPAEEAAEDADAQETEAGDEAETSRDAQTNTEDKKDEEKAALKKKTGDAKDAKGEQGGDPNADLESSWYWDSLFAGMSLSGDWSDDVVRVALTQLGYSESERNFIIDSDGSHKGYTRYGAWYGYPYGDWCAMFVSFSLNYAQIPESAMPRECGCTRWVNDLAAAGLYAPAGSYEPRRGDIIFFDLDGDGNSDHVGLITNIYEDGTIETVEGNNYPVVAQFTYAPYDSTILGYGILPVNPAQNTVTAIDENGEEHHLVLQEEPEQGVEEIAYPAQHFESWAGRVRVAVDAPDGAFPEGTTMEVATVAAEEVIDTVRSAVDAQVVKVEAVDIVFRNADGVEIEPLVPIRVIIRSTEIAKAEDSVVVHVDDTGAAEVVEQLDASELDTALAISELAFEADSFTVYAVAYTVDFEYSVNGETYQFSLPGGEKIALSRLIEVLGVCEGTKNGEKAANSKTYESVQEFMADVANVESSDEHLLKVLHPETNVTLRDALAAQNVAQVFSAWLDEGEQEAILSDVIPADEWVLVSLLPFDTEEKLTITMKDGSEVIIKVTDDKVAQESGTDNLSGLLYKVEISDVETNEDGNDGTVKVGRTYSMHFSFAELGDNQFSTTSALTYKIPDGIKMVQPNGTFNVTYNGQTYTGNTYTYDEATNTITVNFSDTVKALVAKSADADITIDINGQFTGEKTHFDFSGGISKDYTIDSGHDVTVDKSGAYSSSDNKVHYTVTAKSDGKSNNVVITDTVTGTALTYDQGSIQVNGRSDGFTITESEEGFVVNVDSMDDNETLTVTYTASVNFDDITGKGTVTQTGNTVEIKADGDPGEEKTTDVSNTIDYNPLGKAAGAAIGDGNTKTIPWTITVNEQQLKSVAGTTVTDKNNSPDIMSYSGTGITIAVMDGNRTVRTITRTWADLGVSDPAAATGWSYTIPDDSDDLNNTYKYVITYTTEVDASGKISDFQVNNEVRDDEGHSGGGGTNVTPGDDKVTLEKKNESYNAGTSDWSISFNVPKDGLASAVLTDYFPEKWDSEHWVDELLGDIEIEGLLEGESYSVDTSDASKVVITFYKSGEKTEENQGLKANTSDRTVKVTLTTKNADKWVQAYSGDGHTNKASLDVDGQVITSQATSYPKSEGVAKTGSYQGTVTIDGREYPVFKYTLSLYGVSDSSFDRDGKLTLTDKYDDTYLKLYVKPENGEGADWTELRWTGANANDAYDSRTAYEDDSGTITITADKVEFKLDGNGLYKSVYQIYYYLIPKDETALNALEQASIAAGDHKVELENKVTWGDFDDDVTIDYEYPAVEKEQLTSADPNGFVKYKIVLNPDKLTLNNNQPMTMEDAATNISVDYSTIVIEADPAANAKDITYYYRGYTGYYTIPDATKVTITYSARVIGDGDIPISNEATMKGFKDTTSSTEKGGSTAGGSLNIDWVVVYKHEWRKMEKGLNGAVYVLTDKDGNPILYPASAKADKGFTPGEPVTFTTGKIDMNALPDGTHSSEDENWRDGYAWIYLSKDDTGLALQKGITYYFKEYSAPEGYQKDDTIFTFTIAEHPDYDDWEYYKGDILRLSDSKVEGTLEISKTFVGASNLTDTQKKQITFLITGVDGSGNAIKIPYKMKSDGSYEYAPESGLEITYADFENGVYKLDALPNGTYTVTETGTGLGGYTYKSTTYTVDGTTGTASDLSGSVTISDNTKHTFAYTNTYELSPASLTVVKKDGTGNINLYGATFQLYKKNGADYEVVTDHEGLTSDGKFTIDYESRENGVTITGLSDGEYCIKETDPPAGYQKDETPITFTVTDGAVSAGSGNGSNVLTFQNGKVEVKNTLDHTYTLTKVDAFKLSKKLSGAEFAVTSFEGLNAQGDIIYGDKTWTFTTGIDGTIVINADDMDAQHTKLDANKLYFIWETKAPEGYEISNKTYAFYTGSLSDIITQVAQYRSYYGVSASIVSLADGPQNTSVPNTPDSMDLYVYKQWFRPSGEKESDFNSSINEIQVQLHQVITDSDGTQISDSVYPDADTVYTLTKGAGGNSSYLDYKWTGLPTGKSDNIDKPLTYTYYVEEVNIPEGYEAKYLLGTSGASSKGNDNVKSEPDDVTVGASSETKTIQVRNSLIPISLKMSKVWMDDGNDRPQSMVFGLRYTDNDGVEKTPTADDIGNGSFVVNPELPNNSNVAGEPWSYEWTNLNPGTPENPRTYYVVEISTDRTSQRGYADPQYSRDSDGNVIITNTKTTSDKLKVKKVWLNADGTMMDPSKMVPVTLQLQKEEGTKGTGHTVTVRTWTNYWDYSCSEKKIEVADNSDLTISFSSGGAIYEGDPSQGEPSYSTPISGYSVSISSINADITLNYYVAANNYLEASFSGYTEPPVSWSGTVTDVTISDGIKKNGNNLTASDIRVTLDSGNSWAHDWDNLTAPDGKIYRYSVREVNVPAGYEVSYENNDGIQTGIMYVKNTVSEYTRATAFKEWRNAAREEMAAPSGAEVTFTLYQDGRKTNQTVTLDGTPDSDGETDAWVATWEGLEKNKANGEPHTYTIVELTGYTGYVAVNEEGKVTEDSNTVASGGTIINKKVRQISVTKQWLDQSGAVLEETPNGSVRIDLYKKGDETKIIKSITLDGRIDPNGEQTPWVATFSDLEDNTVYVVKESECTLSNFTLKEITPAESAATGDASFTVTNQQTRDVTIDLNIVKVDAADMTTPLGNAQFTLKKLDPAGKGTYLGGTDAVEKTSGETAAADGKTSITEIGTGYYEISETKVPDGYVLMDSGKFYIKVDDEGTITVLTKDTTKLVTEWTGRTLTNEDKLQVDAAAKTITVGNTPGVALPKTGGSGTLWYTLGGALMMLGAATLLYHRSRRGRRRADS